MSQKWETSEKSHKLMKKKSVKKSQTSEKKTQKCKFRWEKVTN